MANNDTLPERRLSLELHALGVPFVRHYVPSPLEGTRRDVDIAVPTVRLAVHVDGCYWHGCPEHCRLPRSNTEWWEARIEANRRRDAETDGMLQAGGWRSVRVWEHEDPEAAARIIGSMVDNMTGRGRGPVELAYHVLGELERARGMYAAFTSPHEAWAVLRKEMDELWDETRRGRDRGRMGEEATEVAATAIRLMLDLGL